MKLRKRLRINGIILGLIVGVSLFAFSTVLATPLPAEVGITPEELDKMAIDPQSWQLQRDMTWDDYKPNPAIDWMKDLNPASLAHKTAWDGNSNRPIIGGLLMFQYLDLKFISSQPVGSSPLSYYAMNPKYANPDDNGKTHNPVIDVYQLFADEEGISREALIEKYTTGENGPDANGLTALDKKFSQWWADFLNKPSEINNYTGISEYWRENSYGKWDIELRPFGPFTIPYFEFETMGGYDMSSGYQTYRDIPPSFRRTAAGTQNANTAFAFDTIAHNIAHEKKLFDGLDFFFLLHAGYDESGVWQEFGQAQFATRKEIPYELGPGPRMKQVEEFFTQNPEYLEIYAQRYTGHYRPQFWADELKKYKDAEPGTYVFHLSPEDWAWVDGYNDQTQKNTRYVAFSSWLAAIGEWSHAVSTVDIQYIDPVSGQTRTRTLRRSTQGENDGMATFAHEFCHINVVADNYGNAWTGAANPLTEPWDIVSRGSFAGPFGDHARWMVPGVEAGSVPTHLMTYLKNVHQEYTDAGEVLEVKLEDLAKNGPVVADIVPRNIPLANEFYPGLAAYGLVKGDYYKALKLDFAQNLTGDWADKNPTASRGFVFTAGKRATNIYVEAVDQSGYDSFTHDFGVLLSRAYDNPRRTYTGGTSPSHQVIDSHLYDIAMIDYTLGDKIADFATYPIAHASQLADATFKAGVSYTDTGYYMNKYKRNPDNTPVIKPRPSDADLSAANWPVSPVSWDIDVTGSIVRWEERNGRDIASGDTVNEYYDVLNKLHIYILQKNMLNGRQIDGKTQQILSYQIGMLHDDGPSAGGDLKIRAGEFSGAASGNYAEQKFFLENTGKSTDIIRISLDGLLAQGRTQEIQVITGITEPVARIVPKFFSDQNAVILNNLYAIDAGETIEFSVYIKADGGTLNKFPAGDLIVTASSETDNLKKATFPLNTIEVADKATAPGGTVDVTYSIKGNLDGFSTLSLDLPYDSSLYTPVSVTPLAALSDPANGNIFVANPAYNGADIIRVAFASNGKFTGDSLLFTVKYKVADTAPVSDIPLDVKVIQAKLNPLLDLYIDIDLQVKPGTLVIGILGDINGDGFITPEDAILLLQMYVGLIDWTPRALLLGDINGDGVIDPIDASLILRIVVGG
ncbi:MAG: dockerin type I domain-containing protein [Clostridiales bacterium]|nr:dockerin type I domain-containing protein [Clostridiales bacterium]